MKYTSSAHRQKRSKTSIAMDQESATTAKEALWAQLQEIQSKEMEAVKKERERLEEEKKSMSAFNPDSSDIISINAGGEVTIQAHRDTLCLASGSLFANLFSGRWEDSCARDDQGRVFFDHDPEFIRLIVNHLRIKKTEDPSKPVPAPSIPADKRLAFLSLLRYFGLFSFFYPEGVLFPDLEILANPEFLLTTQYSDGSVRLSCKRIPIGEGEYEYNETFATCTPALSTDTQTKYFWKCTVSSMNGRILMGVTSTLQKNSWTGNPTTFAWASDHGTIVAGRTMNNDEGWTTFKEGENVWFRLEGRRLTMFRVQENKTLTIDGVAENPCIHFFFYKVQGETEVVLAPLYASERSSIGW